MRQRWLLTLGILFGSLCITSVASAETIRGTVTDSSGKPVRGAIVKAIVGPKAIARYSQANGTYELVVPAGKYRVTVDAFGFATRAVDADTASQAPVNFQLQSSTDIRRLTTAQVRTILPNDPGMTLLKGTCFNCHGFETVVGRSGWTGHEWQSFLSQMTARRFDGTTTPAMGGGFGAGPGMGDAIEKYFGPEGLYSPQTKVDMAKVKHAPLSDAALRATITEYMVPTQGAMVHSLTVDAKRNIVWFSEYDAPSNKIARFNPETEKFEEFPVPVPASNPHTGVVLNDGTFMVALAKFGIPAKLASVDLAGNVKVYEYPEKAASAAHTAALSPDGQTVWITANGGGEVWAFDIKTEKFRAYRNPTPERPPAGSSADLMARARPAMTPTPEQLAAARRRTEEGTPRGGDGYDVAVDSKGIVWQTQLRNGVITSLDPKTGATKIHHTPGMVSARGITVATDDTVWWADYYGHQIGSLNSTTGEIKLLKTPTQESAPYGIVQDRQSGYIWYCDTEGNNVGRIDPKTGEVTEYALPTRNAANRFMGIDARGRAWYPGFFNGRIGVIDPGDSGRPTRTAR